MQNYQTKVLADFTEPGRNSFNLVRLIAAALVIVSHSFLIPYGLGSKEPLQSLTSLTLGQHAVHVFFVISGLTLCRSITLQPSMALYARARLLRIVPALIGFGLFFAFVMGPLATSVTLGRYFSDTNTWLYPLSVPINFQQAAAPPLVFQKVPIAGAINNPLWTIKYEIFAYLSLGIFAALGALRKARYSVVALIVTAFFSIVLQPYQDENGLGALFQAAKFSFCFLLGVVLSLFGKSVPINPIWLFFTVLLALLASRSPAALVAFIVLDAHVAIVVGSSNFGWLTLWTQQNDISYGTYIYGWPIQQFAITVFPALGAFGLGAVSIFATIGLGYLSWKVIEQPALRLKRVEIAAGGKQKS
jgi:peptidoglycan/LPS O-acetylase OafA/YrhL